MIIKANFPINEAALKDITAILKDYEIIAIKRITETSKQDFLSDLNPNTCRFCGRKDPLVTFKKRAHTIPEFTGNKKLFSLYECDSCNEYFNLFENELANYMLPFNSISGIKVKKNKVPKYIQKGQPQIIFLSDKIAISKIADAAVDIKSRQSLEFNLKLPTYIPDYIYRCLIKVGLSILPEQQFIKFSETKDWLMNLNSESNIKPYMIFSSYPTSIPMKEIVCSVLERKQDCNANISKTIVFLSYGSYAFQTYLPYTFENENVEIQVFPYIYPTINDLNNDRAPLRTFNLIDLSSKEQKIGDQITLTITGDIQQEKNNSTKR